MTTTQEIDAPSTWALWRAERDASLRETHGWLTLTNLHWLGATPSHLQGVPGRWWSDDAGVHVQATAADALTVPGTPGPLDGESTTAADEGGSRIAALFGGADHRRIAVEAIRRTGRAGVRLRDSLARARTEFTRVPTFPFDPSWVLEATVRWAAQPYPASVGGAQPGLVHQVQVVGEVDVERGGRSATLRLVGSAENPALLFTDPSTGTAPWRVLHLGPAVRTPGETVRLDFNRAVNLPFAFSAAGTCPRPVDGNALPFAVTAGERAPL